MHDHGHPIDEDDDDYDEVDGSDEKRGRRTRFYTCLLFTFVLAFTIFCLILWGVSKSFSPIVTLKVIHRALTVPDISFALVKMINSLGIKYSLFP